MYTLPILILAILFHIPFFLEMQIGETFSQEKNKYSIIMTVWNAWSLNINLLHFVFAAEIYLALVLYWFCLTAPMDVLVALWVYSLWYIFQKAI